MRTSVADKKFTRLNTNFLTKNLPYSLKGKTCKETKGDKAFSI